MESFCLSSVRSETSNGVTVQFLLDRISFWFFNNFHLIDRQDNFIMAQVKAVQGGKDGWC